MNITRRRARLLLADDLRLVLACLRDFLARRYEVMAAVDSGRTLLERALEDPPDVAVLEIGLPDLDGVEVTRRLKAAQPHLGVVLLTTHGDLAIERRAREAGADGFVSKRAAPEELFRAIDGALALSPVPGPYAVDPADPLSDRQREVVRLVGMGLAMKQIALELGISPKTVEFHKYNAMRRLRLDSTAELVRWARDRSLIPGA